MKKLELNFQQLNAEVLTRSQLKQILGGAGSGGNCPLSCKQDSDCFFGYCNLDCTANGVTYTVCNGG